MRNWLAKWLNITFAVVIVAVLAIWLPLKRPPHLTTDILVLGDSQLSFGAGPVLSTFFEQLPSSCADINQQEADAARMHGNRFAMIGTRSTSLQSWTTQSGRAWELLCHKDKRWGVNASAWGALKPAERRYVQIGETRNFKFCAPGRTPLRNLFFDRGYRPRLLMIFVGGNGAGRLAKSLDAARHDVHQFAQSLPVGMGCIFMMTAPIYSKEHNDTRVIAQANLRQAFAEAGKRCTFVVGHTPATRAAIEGQSQYFKQRDDGTVKDPYHANAGAAQAFLDLRRADLCHAIKAQLPERADQ